MSTVPAVTMQDPEPGHAGAAPGAGNTVVLPGISGPFSHQVGVLSGGNVASGSNLQFVVAGSGHQPSTTTATGN